MASELVPGSKINESELTFHDDGLLVREGPKDEKFDVPC